jgi:hypothetical protein
MEEGGSADVVEDDARVLVEPGFRRLMWADFAEEFGFRPGELPAIREPAPSVTWDPASRSG